MLKKSRVWLLMLMLCLIVSVLAVSAFASEASDADTQYPDADVTILSPLTLTAADEYLIYDGSLHDGVEDLPLQIVMNFKANDTVEEALASGYADWKCDFYLTFSGLAEGSVTADNCYLAGNYGEFGWIVIPTDGLVVEEGVSYPVVSAYDANLTYENICDYVKDFTAAIYIDKAILDANPDFEVSLALKMTSPDDSEVITVGEPAVYDVEALSKPNAEVSVLDPTVLTAADEYLIYDGSLHDGVEDLPLQVVMNFKAQDSFAAAKASKYGEWICDFYLTFEGAEGTFSTKDCYLAGNYGSFGWIAIPAEALAPELEYNVAYPVVAAYDPNLTYENICDYVKDFTAAIYISPELLANPDFKVTLELRMTNPENSDDYMVIGEPAVYTVADLNKGNDITDLKANSQVGGTVDTAANATAIEAAKEALLQEYPTLTEEQLSSATVEIEVVFEAIEIVEGAAAPASYSYTVSPMLGVGESKVKVSTFDAPVTFRLPVHSAETKTTANVYHYNDLIGNFEIKSEGGEKFVEVSSADFSTFTVEPTEDPKNYVAQIGDEKFESLVDALDYAMSAGIRDLVITLIGETDRSNGDYFDLCYTTAFSSITFKQADATTPYYIYDLYTGSRVDGGEFVFDGVNIIVTDQYMFEGNVRLTNNSIVKSVAASNCFHYYSNTVVEPGSKLYGVIEDYRGGSITVDGGRTDGGFNTEADVQAAIIPVQFGGEVITLKNGAYFKVNAANENGTLTLVIGATLNVYDSKVEAWQYIALSGIINIDTESFITTAKLYGAGSIVIDASNLDGRVLLIESADLASFTGDITIIGNEFARYEITESGLEVYEENPAAQIGDKYFTTLADAFAAAQAGDEIVLLADVELTSGIAIAADKNVTLDLAGHSITMSVASKSEGNYIFRNDGIFTVTDSIGDGEICLTYTGAKDSSVSISTIMNYGTLNVEGGTINCISGNQNISYAIDTLNVLNKDSVVNISGGAVIGGASNYCIRMFVASTTCKNVLNVTGGTTYYVWAQNVNEYANKADISITGGKVAYLYVSAANASATDVSAITLNAKAENLTYGAYVYSNSEAYVLENVDGVYTIAEKVFVAQIGDAKFATLADAFAAAKTGDVIILLADVEIVGETFKINDGVSVTLDMNGKKITATDNKAANVSYEIFYIYGELTVIGNGTIELTSTSNDTAWAKYSTIFHNRGGVLTIENGTYKHLGGTAMAYVVDNSGNSYGDATAYINGGALDSTYVAIRNRMDTYGANGGGNGIAKLVINGGELSGKRAVWAQVSSGGCKGDIVITGGKLTAWEGEPALRVGTDAAGTITVAVSGGTFSSEIPAEYCAEGFAPVANGDGTYGVEEATYVAEVDGVKYKTLAEAFAAAKTGDVIILLADVEIVGETFKINDGVSVTLDMNGKKITATDNKAANVSYELFYIYGELTVIGNGTIELTSTSNDTAWAKSSTIFHNRGGVLTIENGTYKHLGGTAMAYVVDNNANSYGDATAYINGGALDSVYIAIRNRMDTYGANGGGNGIAKLVINGGDLSGKYAVWGQVSSAGVKGEIVVTGGSLTSASGRAALLVDSDEKSTISVGVSGGVFSSPIPEEYCAEGFAPVENADGTYGVVEAPSANVTIEYTNVTITENFKMSFAFKKSAVSDWTGYYVVITKTSAADGSEETIIVPVDSWKSATIGTDKYYVVEYAGIAAKEMSDVVSVTVYGADDVAVSDATTDSIKGYAMRKLSHYNDDEKLATLLVDMLNYGAEAQIFFGYATDKLANAELTEEQKAFASEAREYSAETYSFSYAEGYSFPAANTLTLDYNAQLKVSLDLRALELSDDAKITVTYVDYAGRTVAKEVSVGDYKSKPVYVTCDTLTARDFSTAVEFKLVDGGVDIFTFTSSIEGFTARLADGNNKVDICTALMKYGDSAAAYFNK